MATRQYKGPRIIPVFAHDVEWDITETYNPLTMVQHQGETFMSRQYVPTGIQLPDSSQDEEYNDYWVHMSNWNAQVESYRQEVLQYNGRISAVEDGLPVADFDSEHTVSDALAAINAQIGTGFDAEHTISAAISAETTAREGQDAIRIMFFDDVASMKASDDLYDGAVCRTSGFYSANDGGAAYYSIADAGTANEMDVIECGDLYAVLIPDAQVNALQFGCKNDESEDVTDILNYILAHYTNVCIPNGTYLIDGLADISADGGTVGVVINSNTTLELGENAIIKQTQGGNKPCSYILNVFNADNVTIRGGILIGDKETHVSSGGGTDEWGAGLNISYSSNVTIENMVIQDCHGDGIYIGQTYFTDGLMAKHNKNVHVDNVKVYNTYRNGISICDCNHYFLSNIFIDTVSGVAPQVGIDVELEGTSTPSLTRGHFSNINIINTTAAAMNFIGQTDAIIIDGLHTDKALAMYANTIVNIVNSVTGGWSVSAGAMLLMDNCRFTYGLDTDVNSRVRISNSKIAAFNGTTLGAIEFTDCEVNIPSPVYKNAGAGNYASITFSNCRVIFNEYTAGEYYLIGFAGNTCDVRFYNCVFECDIVLQGADTNLKKYMLYSNNTRKFIVENCSIDNKSGIEFSQAYAFITCNACLANGNAIAPYANDVNGTNQANAVNFVY